MKSLLLAVTALVAVWAAPAPEHLTGQALVDFVNANTNLWKAQLNTKWTLPQFKKRLMNSKYVKVPAGTPEVHHEVQNLASIPASFDGRDQWGATCPSVKWIRDQSDCGSCWAFAAAEIASDRTCIDNPNIPIMLSAEDILACCGFSCGDGCEGGYPIEAMKWWVSKGVVTGTSYLDHQGCKPYSIAPCGHHNDTYYKECPSDIYPTPKCTLTCQTGYPTPYPQDKHFAKSAYKVSRSVSSIQTEIMTYGPVEAAFTVYEDFYNYKSGVYHHVTGQELGGHAVKILGWGVESSVKYWLVANSWDTDWGESGYFRIRQGNDECGIEDGIVAGLPKS